MKASNIHAALAAVLTACVTPTVLAFLPPPAALAPRSPFLLTPPSGSGPQAPSAARAPPAAPRAASCLAAAREDCKSCMEAELLAEERKGGDAAAARRAALEEVCFFAFFRNVRHSRDTECHHAAVSSRW